MKVALILLSSFLGIVYSQYDMKVNYYADQYCGNTWMNSWDIGFQDVNQCLEYNIPGAGSFNIANCYGDCYYDEGSSSGYSCNSANCYCTFFVNQGCTGTSVTVGVSDNGGDIINANCGDTGETYWEPQSAWCWIQTY
jgi:hypothetical protein